MIDLLAFVVGFGLGVGFWVLFTRNGKASVAEWNGLRLGGASRAKALLSSARVFFFGP